MNLTRTLSRFVESNHVATASLREASLGYSLASLSTIDTDEHLFRRITEVSRDLGSLTHERQREIAYYLADVNPFAKRIVNMTRDFVVGKGREWKIQATNDKVRELLKKHWNDPINNWKSKIRTRGRELGLAGEQCYTAITGSDGIVRLGYVDPGVIGAIKPDPDNFEILREVVLKKKDPGDEERRLKIINYDMSERRLVGKTEGEDQYVDSCFFFAINKPIRATRGRSDLFALADSLDMLDQFHFNRMERSALANTFIWDVLLKGSDEKAQKDWLAKNKAPKPGAVRVRNESVEWDVVAPNLQASDASQEGRMMRTPILTGSGYPEHWLFGVGENANRASAYEMGDPPMRMVGGRQEDLIEILEFILRYQIDEAVRAKVLIGVKEEELYDYSIDAPEISSRDMQKAAQTLEAIGRALASALLTEIITPKTAIGLFAFAAAQMGMAIDAEAEIKALLAAQGEKDKADFDGLNLEDDEEDEEGDRGQEEPEGAMA